MRKVMNIVIGVSAIVVIINIVCVAILICSSNPRRGSMYINIMVAINLFLFVFFMLARAWGIC